MLFIDFIENGRQKCAIYFPVEIDEFLIFTNHINNNQSNGNYIRTVAEKIFSEESVDPDPETLESNMTYNFFLIKNIGICKKNGYTVRKLKLYYGDCICGDIQSSVCYHYWFPGMF